MSSVIIAGNTSGTITLDAPDVAGTTTLTLPATSGTVIVNSGAQTIEFADGSASAPSITNSGDTNTGIFFSAADTIDFTEGGTAVGQFDSSANFKFNSGYGSVATAYGCRAWVNFNGTGTVAIRASGNVTSITDNGTGDYTVNFTNAMPDTSYAVATQDQLTVNTTYAADNSTKPYVFATGSLRVRTSFGATSLEDRAVVMVSIFR
jgi:hypothetical protein